MRIAVTGATGFIGQYLVTHLVEQGHQLRCWYRDARRRDATDGPRGRVEWIAGELGDVPSCHELVRGCDAVVHAALYRPGREFRGSEGDLIPFVEKNLVGSLHLIEAARASGVERFVFFSTCAVHDLILDDRPLDETHPLWPSSHYGAHKAAIEKFVHSYGLGQGYSICALRPTGVYGVARPVQQSKWYDLVSAVVKGQTVECRGGGKEVHAADVAKATAILLSADAIEGQAYNCYDRYVSEHDVASIAKRVSGSSCAILGQPTSPRHQIVTDKLQSLGMRFGGTAQLEQTITQLVDAVG